MSDHDKGPGNPGKVENLKAMLAWQDHAVAPLGRFKMLLVMIRGEKGA